MNDQNTSEHPKQSKPWRSLRSLAKGIGRSPSNAHRIVHRGDWPFGTRPNKHWTAENVLPWVAANVRSNKADPEDEQGALPFAEGQLSQKGQAELRLVRERTAKIRLDREIKAGRYMERQRVEAERLARIQVVKSALLALPRSVRQRADWLPAKSRGRLNTLLEKLVKDILEHFADDGSNGDTTES